MTKRKLSAQCLQRLLVTACICLFLTVANASESTTIINKINQAIDSRAYRDAIRAMNEYELNIVSQFPKPSYSDGFFKCTKSGLSFHSPFDDWHTVSEDALEIDRNTLLQVGYDFLLTLEDSSETKQLMLLDINMNYVMRRMLNKAELPEVLGNIDIIKQQSVQLTALFGALKSNRLEKINSYDVIIQEIVKVPGGPQTMIYIVYHKGRLFFFILKSSSEDMEQFQKDTKLLLKSINIEPYQISEANLASDIKTNLNRIAQLENKQDLHTALDLLYDLRDKAKRKLPQPKVIGTKVLFSSYGVSLTNPDKTKYSLQAETDNSGMCMAMLKEKYAIGEEGLMVMLLDFTLAYSPAFVEMVKSDENIKRDTLVGVGRGGAINIGEIIEEQFVPFKGEMAYQAIVKMSAFNNMKARIMVVPSEAFDFAIMILQMNSSLNFNTKMAEYDKIIKNNIVAPIKKNSKH